MRVLSWLASPMYVSKEDILIVGMPKSGTTQLKGKLAYLLFDIQDTDAVNKRVKEYGGRLDHQFFGDKIGIVKTHRPPLKFLTRRHEKIILLMRDPIDNYVSYWYYMRAKLGVSDDIMLFLEQSKFFDWYLDVFYQWSSRASIILDQNTLRNDKLLAFKLKGLLGKSVEELENSFSRYQGITLATGNKEVESFVDTSYDFFNRDNSKSENIKRTRIEYEKVLIEAYEAALLRY